MKDVSLLRLATHAAILAGPLALVGRTNALSRPQALACMGLVLLLGEVESASRRSADPSRPGAPGTRLALISALGLLATVWGAAGFPSFASSHSLASWSWLGALPIALGITLRAIAIRTLGRAFTSETVAAPGHALVTRGIYARMRHPSDVGLVLVAFGLCVLGSSVAAAIVASLVVLPSVVLRMMQEERVLAARHATKYADYRRRVGIAGVG